jgi:hypothetical protein
VNTNKASLATVLKERRVIPRWKAPRRAVETFERNQDQLTKRLGLASPWIKRLSAKFVRSPSVQIANELYETARLLGRDNELGLDVRELASKFREPLRSKFRKSQGSVLVDDEAELEKGSAPELHYEIAARQIKRLRAQLTEDSARPLSWSELARNYLMVGRNKKAVRAMLVALRFSSRNRYLCRAATRLFVHVDEPDRALHLLRGNPSLASDPWLLAAEIAASSVTGKESRRIDSAKRLITSNDFSEMQVSELASAVGTVE